MSYAGGFAGVTGLNIGWLNQGGADYHFAGVIDEIALHNRVLPDSEIRRHYADGALGPPRAVEVNICFHAARAAQAWRV